LIVLAFLAIQFILATRNENAYNERGNVCTNEDFIKQRYSSTFERAYDKPTSSSMLPFMKKLAKFLDCPVRAYTNNTQSEVLSLSVEAIGKLEPLINYFDKYPVIGEKLSNYIK
jgi:hypothetical protein